jgi:hypothetical protein
MSNIKSIISTASLYIMFGVWSFIHMMEYKYFTRIEQYDSIVDNMDRCNKKYTELLLKMIHMENRIAELEDILYITDELSLSEETTVASLEIEETSVTTNVLEIVASLEVVEEEPKVVEESVASLEAEETTVLEVAESVTRSPVASLEVVKEETKAADNFDAGELVDLSTEEKETNPNPNKKGWVKTLLFL